MHGLSVYKPSCCCLMLQEMLFIFDGGLDCIKDLYGGFLVLMGYDTFVDEGLQGLSVFSLKNHLELLQALLTGVFGLCVDVEGFEEVDCMGIENFPLIGLVLHGESEFGSFPRRGVASRCHLTPFLYRWRGKKFKCKCFVICS